MATKSIPQSIPGAEDPYTHTQGHNVFCVLVPITKGEKAKEGEVGNIKAIKGEKTY